MSLKARALEPALAIRRDRERGYALPMVLAAIAALALIAAAAFRDISATADVMATFAGIGDADRALLNAESEAMWAFLTAAPGLEGALVMAGEEGPSPGDPFAAPAEPERQWRADGEARLSGSGDLRAIVAYRDAAGLAPINSLSDDALAAFLEAAGLDRTSARTFAARIADYADADDARRFLGAERADYRLYSRPAPSNSPLRGSAELANVLDFAEVATPAVWRFIDDYATFSEPGRIMRADLAPDALGVMLEKSGFADDPTLTVEGAPPSDRARFLLQTTTSTGLTRVRAIEIMRTAGAADRPFRRVWVYDRAAPNDGFDAENARLEPLVAADNRLSE